MSEKYLADVAESVDDLTITNDDIEKHGVMALRQTPNRGGTYGTNGLSAEELKKRFDKLPIHIADRLNLLISMLAAGTFKIGGEESISELLDSVGNGTLAKALKVSNIENAKSLYDLWCDISDGDLAKELKLSAEGELAEALDSKADAKTMEEELGKLAKFKAPLTPLCTLEPNTTIDNITAKGTDGKPAYADSFPVDCFNRRPLKGDIFFGYGRTIPDKVAFHMMAEMTGEFAFANGREYAVFKALEVIADYKIQSDTYGYYYSYIDITNRKIYLTTNRVVPAIGTADKTDSTFATPAYPIGGKLCLVNGNKYDWGALGLATLKKIHNNVIEYEGELGFSTIFANSDFSMDSYTLFVIEAPDVGAVKVREGGMSLGDAAARALGHNAVAEGRETLAVGNYSHAEGRETRAHYSSHAEGRGTTASGENSHAEGRDSAASGIASHAEGNSSAASGIASHAEGNSTRAIGNYSHTEGYGSEALGERAHAEGHQTKAQGYASHAEGSLTVVEEDAIGAHAEGRGTVATGQFSHVQGKWNERDDAKRYAHIQGWGTSDTDRKNIHTIGTEGNAWYRGDVLVGGTSQDDTDAISVKALKRQVTTNADAITLLGGNADPDTVDSIKDLVDYVNEHGAEVTGMKADIKANADAIAGLSACAYEDILPITKGGTGATTSIDARAKLGLGAAATFGITHSVPDNDSNLVTSRGVYNTLYYGHVQKIYYNLASNLESAGTVDIVNFAGSKGHSYALVFYERRAVDGYVSSVTESCLIFVPGLTDVNLVVNFSTPRFAGYLTFRPGYAQAKLYMSTMSTSKPLDVWAYLL